MSDHPPGAGSHVVSGLIAKRAEIAGLIEYHLQEAKRIGADLQHLDATIRLFAPDYDMRSVRAKQYRRKNSHFKPGECGRLILDVLRECVAPVSTEAVALSVMSKKRLSVHDDELLRFTKKAVINALGPLARRGLVVAVGLAPDGLTKTWELA